MKEKMLKLRSRTETFKGDLFLSIAGLYNLYDGPRRPLIDIRNTLVPFVGTTSGGDRELPLNSTITHGRTLYDLESSVLLLL